MVAYSFQRQFELPIIMMEKLGTIRRHGRRRHARVGSELQLYFGMRTRSCRLIARATCDSSQRIRLFFRRPRVILGEVAAGVSLSAVNHVYDFDAFARTDGFPDWDSMAAFWAATHGRTLFDGRRITWSPESVQVAL